MRLGAPRGGLCAPRAEQFRWLDGGVPRRYLRPGGGWRRRIRPYCVACWL